MNEHMHTWIALDWIGWDSTTSFEHGNFIKFRYVFYIGNLFYLTAVYNIQKHISLKDLKVLLVIENC